MKLSEFRIGETFAIGAKRFRCTDIGSRVVVAIPLEVAVSSTARSVRTLSETEATREGWLNGPPYAVHEIVFDEYDLEQCEREAIDA